MVSAELEHPAAIPDHEVRRHGVQQLPLFAKVFCCPPLRPESPLCTPEAARELLGAGRLADPQAHALGANIQELLAGGVAGGMGKTCVAPLERVKILFQARTAIPRSWYPPRIALMHAVLKASTLVVACQMAPLIRLHGVATIQCSRVANHAAAGLLS